MVLRQIGAPRRVLVATVLVAVVSALAVSTSVGSASAAKSKPKIDPNGTFVYPTDTTGIHWDPVKAASSGAFWATAGFAYEPLMRGVLDGPPQPGLASSIKIVDPSNIDITLRENVKFQDGTPVTPDAVKMTLERNREAVKAVPVPPALRADAARMQTIAVTGANTVRVTLDQPIANTFLPILTGVEGAIISPKALTSGVNLDTTPSGAGPFKLVSYTPGQTVELVKNPDYWDVKSVKWGKLQLANFPTTTAGSAPTINALTSGQISFNAYQTPADWDALNAAGVNNELMPSATGVNWALTCNSRAPLDNVKVRQALQYATDREAFNKLYMQGRGEVAWSLYPKSDTQRHVPALDNIYPHNVKKAKQLLAEAGYPNGITVNTYITTGGPQNAEILQQQWKEAGITVNIVNVPPAQAVSEGLVGSKGDVVLTTVTRAGLDRLVLGYTKPGITNLCTLNDPKLNELVNAIPLTAPNSKEEKAAYAKAETYLLEQAYSVVILFQPFAAAWYTNIGGVTDDNSLLTYSPLPGVPNFRVIYVTKTN